MTWNVLVEVLRAIHLNILADSISAVKLDTCELSAGVSHAPVIINCIPPPTPCHYQLWLLYNKIVVLCYLTPYIIWKCVQHYIL